MIYPRYLDRHLIAASCAGGQRWMLNVTSGLLSASLPLMGLGNFLFQVSVILISIPLLLPPRILQNLKLGPSEKYLQVINIRSDVCQSCCQSLIRSEVHAPKNKSSEFCKEKNRSTTLKVPQHVLHIFFLDRGHLHKKLLSQKI